MRTKLLVFDWDGTWTSVNEEGAPFCEGYYEDLFALT